MTGHKAILLSTTAVALLGACSDQPAAPAAAREAPVAPLLSAAPQARVVPGRYIVVFHDGVENPAGLATRMVAAHAGKLHITYEHGLTGFTATLPSQAVEGLRHDPRVKYIEPDQWAIPSGTQTNPSWNLDRIDQRDLPLDDVYYYPKTGAGVRVYVIDSGIETTHPEFGGRASFGWDACYVQCNSGDGFGHGTKVAGIIGSTKYGVAKGASMVSVRVYRDLDLTLNDSLALTSTILAGVKWVTANHVKPAVANISSLVAASPTLDAAVLESITAGVTYVAGAGNGNVDACSFSPARISQVITVGGIDRLEKRWENSNFGPCVDVYAPAYNISTTRTKNGYSTTEDGTSYAAPQVAGYAAMLLEWVPTMKPADIHNAVINYSTKDRIVGLGAPSYNRILYTVFGQKTRSVGS